MFRTLHSLAFLISLALLQTTVVARESDQPLFDKKEVRDQESLEVTVLQDWKLAANQPSVRQKLIEITVCEWWPGQKVRLPVTLNVPASGKGPCTNVIIANQSLAKKPAPPKGEQLALLKDHGVAVVLIGMSTIDAMEPVGDLHLGMKKQLLATKNPRYTPAWIWGMSQMRALTAAFNEPEAIQAVKVLTTGGSKRGIASAAAGIHDDRFTAIMPVVAPPLGNPGASDYVIGTEPGELGKIDEQFYIDLLEGKLGLEASVKAALKDRSERRAKQRITLEQAESAGWTSEEIKGITDVVWSPSRITDHLPKLKNRGLEIFYNVGTNDSVSPALFELGQEFPDFPICIIPGGQHGGPATAGYTIRTPMLPRVLSNFTSFARHHFFGERDLIAAPVIRSDFDKNGTQLTVTLTFPDGTEPQENELHWCRNRSKPYTLPYEYDAWESVKMKQIGPAKYQAKITKKSQNERIDFLSLHTHTENGLSLTVSSPYQSFQ